MMTKVRIDRPIYIRRGAGRNFEVLASIFPSGNEIMMDGVETGENWKGISNWYYKINDKGEKQYYWGGGVSLFSFSDSKSAFVANANESFLHNNSEDETKWKVGWGHVDLEIWKIWREFNKQGEGVKVAVIDTGVFNQANDLAGRISSSSLHIVGNSLDDNLTRFHGTRSAGLIGANGATAGTVFGVAPKCELIVIKAGNVSFFPADLTKAMRSARALKPKIISLSIEDSKEISSELADEIKLCKQEGILVLAAAGDIGNEQLSYPAAYDGAISVGAYFINANEREICLRSNRNDNVKFLAPGSSLLTTSPQAEVAFYDATSASTAFAAGMLALVASCCENVELTYENLVEALLSGECTARLKVPAKGEGHGVLQPFALINYLQKNKSPL